MTGKSRFVLALSIASLLTASSAFAATPQSFTFGLLGGMAIPTGDLGDVAKSGFAGGVHADYGLNNMFGLGAEILYNSNEADGFDATLSTIAFGLHGEFEPAMSGMVQPHFLVGGGLYNLSSDIEGSEDQNKFGVMLGAGADWQTNPAFSLGLDVRYHNVFTDEEESGTDAAQIFNVLLHVKFSTTGATK